MKKILLFAVLCSSIAIQAQSVIVCDYKPGDTVAVVDASELPELPRNQTWTIKKPDFIDEGGLPFDPNEPELIEYQLSGEQCCFTLNATINIDDRAELPLLPEGYAWKYQYTEEPPYTSDVYKLLRNK